MVLGISQIDRLTRFEKGRNRLSKKNQEAVDRVIAELLEKDELPPGRNLKKIESREGAWAVRVNKGIRLTFEVSNSTCILRNVGDHDKTLDNP